MHTNYKKERTKVLGFALPENQAAEFAVLAGGIVCLYCVYGWLQEYINTITKKENVHASWFLTCLQFFTYAFFSFILGFPLKVPPKRLLIAFAKVGACSVATIGFSNNA